MKPFRSPSATLPLALAVLALFAPRPARAVWDPVGEPVPAPCALAPVSCPDAGGGLFTFWSTLDGVAPGMLRIVAQHRLADGSTAPGWAAEGRTLVVVPNDLPVAASVAVAPDGAGGAFVFARENRTILSSVPLQHRLFRMQADGSLHPAWPTGGLLLGREDHAGAPALARDGAGGVYVGMQDYVGLGLRTGGPVQVVGTFELRLARVAGDGTLAPGWPAAGVLVRGVAPESLLFQPVVPFAMLADDAGGAFLAWADSSDGANLTRLWRYGPGGAPADGWPAAGVPVTGAPLATPPSLATDGSGGLYAGWTDSLAFPALHGSPKVLHLDGAGELVAGWPPAGLALTGDGDPAPYRWLGGLLGDDAGGVFAAYVELDVANDESRVRLVRRTGTGAVAAGWAAEGVHVAFPGSAYPGFVRPAADANAGVHLLAGLDPMPALRHVRLDAGGGALPGWSLATPRTLATGGRAAVGDVVADGDGGVYVLAGLGSSLDCDVRAYQPGLNEVATAGTGTPLAVRALALAAGPNPSAGAVGLTLALPRPGAVAVDVLDAGGRRVRAWRAPFAARTHRIAWDGRDEAGEVLAPGIYLVIARAGGEQVVQRVALLH